jgi:hypothetical protein
LSISPSQLATFKSQIDKVLRDTSYPEAILQHILRFIQSGNFISFATVGHDLAATEMSHISLESSISSALSTLKHEVSIHPLYNKVRGSCLTDDEAIKCTLFILSLPREYGVAVENVSGLLKEETERLREQLRGVAEDEHNTHCSCKRKHA